MKFYIYWVAAEAEVWCQGGQYREVKQSPASIQEAAF